jgi:hypothetical protein
LLYHFFNTTLRLFTGHLILAKATNQASSSVSFQQASYSSYGIALASAAHIPYTEHGNVLFFLIYYSIHFAVSRLPLH